MTPADLRVPAVAELDHPEFRGLTAQPRRDGAGERWPAFQLSSGTRHVVMASALDGAPRQPTVPLLGLAPEATHQVSLLGPGADPHDLAAPSGTGAALDADGITLHRASGATSWLLLIEEVPGK